MLCRCQYDDCFAFYRYSFLGGDGTEVMALYRVSGHLYTVSFDSNLGDVMVRRPIRTSG